MAFPILSARRQRRQAELTAAIEAGVEKAISPMVAQAAAQSQGSSGATYPVLRGTSNPSDPFNQTGGYGDAFVPLPRPDGDFNSLFGPGYPLVPSPLDPLTDSGRTMTRRAQYLVSANLQLIDRRVPWSVLKGLAEDVDVIARCIQITQDALVGLDWSWGFSPMIINQIMTEMDLTNASRASAIAQEKYGDELQRVSEFFEAPDKRMDQTFSEWLTSIIFSHLVYDGVCVAPGYNLGGELTSLSVIDTPTIKILLDNQGFLPAPPAPAYQQILYGFPRGEYQAEGEDRDGNIPNGYTDDQLFYKIRRPRADSVYGYSQVEECINIATIYMERQAWLHAEYSHGVSPKMMIETEGTESWTPEQLGYYQQILNDQMSGQTQRRQQFLLLRAGMKGTQLKGMEEAYKSDYDNYLILQMGAKFGIPQQMLGIKQTAGLNSGGAGKQQSDQAEAFATDALRNFLIDCINDMARRFMGVGPELTMTATGGGNDDDNLTRAQADASDVDSGIRTRNEIRSERGKPLDPSPEADQLAITVATGVQFLSGLLDQQKAAAALAAAPPPPPQSKTVTVAPDGTTTTTHGAPATDAHGDSASVHGGTAASVTATSASVAPKAKTADNEAPAGVTPKDDSRQPDADAEKELAAFAAFAKTRAGKLCRDFEFHHQTPESASELNTALRAGYDVVKSLISAMKATTINAAGICLKADDTGRVLLVQRSIDNSSRPTTGGQWEWPGGVLNDGDDPLDAAQREFTEEVGVDLPKGKVVGSWTTSTGYQCFVYVIKHETDLELDDARSSLDGSGDDEIENVAWWDPNDLQANPAVRTEIQSSDWALIGSAKKAARMAPEATVVPSNALQCYVGTPTATQVLTNWPDADEREFQMRKNELLIHLLDQRDQAEWAAKAQAQMVDIAKMVHDELAPDLDRLSAANQQLMIAELADALTKQKAPIINVEPTPIQVDATSTHTHNVAAPNVTVDATSTHHVAAPEVHVESPVTVNVPKAPKPTVVVQPAEAKPQTSKISRDAEGNIIIEREAAGE